MVIHLWLFANTVVATGAIYLDSTPRFFGLNEFWFAFPLYKSIRFDIVSTNCSIVYIWLSSIRGFLWISFSDTILKMVTERDVERLDRHIVVESKEIVFLVVFHCFNDMLITLIYRDV